MSRPLPSVRLAAPSGQTAVLWIARGLMGPRCRHLSTKGDYWQPQERLPNPQDGSQMPGMTISSLLPKAARAPGIPFGELLHRLVQLALEPQ